MGEHSAMVLLDDVREPERGEHYADALLYTNPRAVFAAHRPADVERVLNEADAARIESGGHLAGYLGYEAGLALEERLAPLADMRSGANGPLIWLGLFDEPETIPAGKMADWLAEQTAGSEASPAGIGPLEPAISPGAYRGAFDALQESIKAGDIYQANLTLPLTGGFTGDPLALYAALRPAARAGYGGAVFDGSHWLLSFSPELFVSVKDGKIKAKPMKGTRPRGSDAEQDQALYEELASSQKDRAENLMIVDLLRNDLSRVAEAGSVSVDEPFAIESYPTVHQMVSTVYAEMKAGTSAADLLRAIFPCGSITGAPKIRAMELIGDAERDPRGPYCGAIGRIGPPNSAGNQSGISNAAFNVAIRTLRLTEIENGKGKAVLGVGGAIVADSDADTEWREAIVKGAFARASTPDHTAANFDLIETMRFDPASGLAFLESHLARMKKSAIELGFMFDRHEARNQLHALCFDLTSPAKIRLLASRSGKIALQTEALPPQSPQAEPLRCIVLPLPVVPTDWRLRHKTSDRGFYEDARIIAQSHGADEALFIRPNEQDLGAAGEALLTEGSITNIFVRGKEGGLATPPLSLGLLPGILRGSLIESGEAYEANVTLNDLAEGFFLGNALRGLVPAVLLPSKKA